MGDSLEKLAYVNVSVHAIPHLKGIIVVKRFLIIVI